MKVILGFTVIEEQEHMTVYQINHLKIQCNFLNVIGFFVVDVYTHEYPVKTVSVNIKDYYNEKAKKIVRLQMLIDDLIRQINAALPDSRQTNIAAASVQYPGRSNVPQQQQIPGLSSACSTGGSATPDLSSFHYSKDYPDKDPSMDSLYSSASADPNLQLAWAYHQQRPTDQHYGYSNEQNMASQQASSTSASNNGGRSSSNLGQYDAGNDPSLTLL